MSLDGLPPAHLRVLLDGLPVFERYGLLLAGGYAFRAHEILHRPSQDLDFATRDDTPLPEIATHVQLAFQRAGGVPDLGQVPELDPGIVARGLEPVIAVLGGDGVQRDEQVRLPAGPGAELPGACGVPEVCLACELQRWARTSRRA